MNFVFIAASIDDGWSKMIRRIDAELPLQVYLLDTAEAIHFFIIVIQALLLLIRGHVWVRVIQSPSAAMLKATVITKFKMVVGDLVDGVMVVVTEVSGITQMFVITK